MASGGFGDRRSSSRRFLPADPRTSEPWRLTPQLALRVGVLGALALGVFALLFLRLWSLQVLSGDRYLNAAQNNQLRTVRIEAPRGPILDREGRIIVSNVPGTAVQVWPADLPKQGRYAMLKRLSVFLHAPLPRILKEIESRKGDPLTPVTIKTAVHEYQVSYIAEHRSEFPGVSVVQAYLRDYPFQSLGAQVLGYVGEVSEDELKEAKKHGSTAYRGGDKIGKSGIERSFDLYLRGTSGLAQLRVDSLGRPQSDLQPRQQPQPGNAIRLTLDMSLQRAAERALREGIQLARNDGRFNANGGSIVALDPRDGAILALASNPTYKPSTFVGRVDPKKLRALAAPDANTPQINRSIAGRYPPGSTFKPVTALAALQDHIISSAETIQCTPFKVYGLDKQKFKNWNPVTNTPMTLPTALSQSCDTYFYDIGQRYYDQGPSGWSRLQAWAERFGFGHTSGLDIGGEDPGLLPTPAWRKRTYSTPIDRAWNPGDSIQLTIGQKDIAVTPLQMARFYAVLANGGKLVTPYLVQDVEQPGSGGSSPVTQARFAPDPPRSLGLDSGALAVVNEGLYAATHDKDGTSSGVFGSFPVPVAGKTGTAEKIVNLPGYPIGHQEDQAWWCGYGPYDGSRYNGKPAIVVCVLIENGGHGGVAAAPAALRVFEQWFNTKAGAQGVVASD